MLSDEKIKEILIPIFMKQDQASIHWPDIFEEVRAIEAAVLEAQPTDQRLINLLCRIHRDGGHYIAEYGLDKAVEDADIRVAEQNAAFDVQSKQEPVAWMNPHGGVLQRLDTGIERETYTIPLYAAPVVQPDKYEALTTMLEGALAHAEVFGNGNISTEVIRKLIAAAEGGT